MKQLALGEWKFIWPYLPIGRYGQLLGTAQWLSLRQ
jgi:hypothetical protein